MARGERLTRLLRQGQYVPYRISKTIITVIAGSNGFTDDLPVADMGRYEKEMLQFIETKHGKLFDEIEEKKKLDDDLMGRIKGALSDFGKLFSTSAK